MEQVLGDAKVENARDLRHMNLTPFASLIMMTPFASLIMNIEIINQQLLLEVFLTASTSITKKKFFMRQVISKVAASEDKVAQAEALAQEAEKNPLPPEERAV